MRKRKTQTTIPRGLAASVILALGAFLACKDVTLDRANQAPVTSVSANPESGPAPLTVAFTSASSDPDGSIAGYAWSFGDGATSNQANPTHQYTTAGNFTATLEVKDDAGATTDATVDIVVGDPQNPPPTATVSATPISGQAPLFVTFTGGGSDPGGSIASFSWMFGDGGSSTEQNPSHTYQSGGNFTATLTVTDNGGATGSKSMAITVGSNRPPTATASATPTSGMAPLAVVFTGSGSDPDGTIASYRWTFGDSNSSSTQSPSHSYVSAGNYIATLTVTDNNGATGSSSVAISVNSAGNQPPVASASATPTSGTSPLSVAFTGSGTDADGTIASYAWTFGDDGTSSARNPAHMYTSPGNYTATLTVTDNVGATGSSSLGIIVSASTNASPVANAGADQVNLDPGVTVHLSGAASSDPDGLITSYQWTQTAGTAVTLAGATTATPSFVAPLNKTATYAFTLTVTDGGSPQASAQDAVTVATRVTYLNTTKALIDARGTQSNGNKLGCTASGCHKSGDESPALDTYTRVNSNRSKVRSKIQSGSSMRKYLATGEPAIITSWIDNGAPEKN